MWFCVVFFVTERRFFIKGRSCHRPATLVRLLGLLRRNLLTTLTKWSNPLLQGNYYNSIVISILWHFITRNDIKKMSLKYFSTEVSMKGIKDLTNLNYACWNAIMFKNINVSAHYNIFYFCLLLLLQLKFTGL